MARVEIGVTYAHSDFKTKAQELAKQWSFKLAARMNPRIRFWLLANENGISLHDSHLYISPLRIDFLNPKNLYRLKNLKLQKNYLLRAIGKPGLDCDLLDAAAGLGQDAYLMAACGFKVTMLEQNQIVMVLLTDALNRLFNHEKYGAYFKDKLSLVFGKAQQIMPALNKKPEIIYLDPMYPETKKTALPEKGMQYLRELNTMSNNSNLLKMSLEHASKKVIVKRPLKADFLENLPASHQIIGKTTRYDVYMTSSVSSN